MNAQLEAQAAARHLASGHQRTRQHRKSRHQGTRSAKSRAMRRSQRQRFVRRARQPIAPTSPRINPAM
eukprot:2301575-Pyramimonas_sp.AAC.1